MSSKFFNVNKPEQIVTIVEDKDKFYELSDGNMIKKDTFMQKYQPLLEGMNESVAAPTKPSAGNYDVSNPDAFFNSTTIPENVVSGIKQADPTRVPEVSDATRTEVVHKGPGQVGGQSPDVHNESLVKRIDEPVIPNNTNTDVSQYKVYDNDDDAYADFEKKNQSNRPQQPKPQQTNIDKEKETIELLFDDEKLTFGEEEAIARRSKRLMKLPTNQPPQPQVVPGEHMTGDINTEQRPSVPVQLSPIEMMFSTFKRKHPITVNVEFTDLIGEPDFVKLMVENMDGDIVGYYKKKVMENIMKDLSKIEISVEEKIKSEIFGDTEIEPVVNFKPEPELIEKVKNTMKKELIPGGTTKTGKQKYKYVDDKGNVKELLPSTAKSKGYEPYTVE